MDQEGSLIGIQELAPQTTNLVRGIVAKSLFIPDATAEMVTKVSLVQPERPGRMVTYLAETRDGLDVLVTKVSDVNADQGDPELQSTEWMRDAVPAHPGYYLEGLLEEKGRKLGTPDGIFGVRVLTSPDRFNRVMTDLGRKPGVDSFKLVPVNDGVVTAKFYAEAAARLEIPAARKKKTYVEHDLRLSDHIHAWWSMPTEVAQPLQARAKEVLASPEETREARIVEFSDGLDKLGRLTNEMVPFLSDMLDNDWEVSEDPESRTTKALDFINNFVNNIAKPGIDNDNARLASLALIETGLIEPVSIQVDGSDREVKWPTTESGSIDQNSDVLLKAKEGMARISTLYARNIVNMLALAREQAEQQGIAQKADPRRGQLIDKLMVELDPEAVTTFINQNQSPN